MKTTFYADGLALIDAAGLDIESRLHCIRFTYTHGMVTANKKPQVSLSKFATTNSPKRKFALKASQSLFCIHLGSSMPTHASPLPPFWTQQHKELNKELSSLSCPSSR